MDFSDCPTNGKVYSGSERKIGVEFNNHSFILKFRKADQFGQLGFNHVSEHIGSSIIASVGIPAQRTCLGTYRGEDVVALRDFTEGAVFVPFNDVGESTLETDRDRYQYTYEDIMEMLQRNKRLSNVEETVESFWDLYIMDAFLGNFDRHGYNWGFLRRNGRYTLAPVFDNGSCLFPRMTDEEEMLRIMDSEEETRERVFRFPTSQIRLGDRESPYHDVISSMWFEECNRALLRIFPRIDLDKVFGIIDDVDIISETHRMFYRHMLRSCYTMILEPTYRRLRDEI